MVMISVKGILYILRTLKPEVCSVYPDLTGLVVL